jgi:hypothetical protein
MLTKPLKILLVTSFLVFVLSGITVAQLKKDTISAYHKSEIIAMFKRIDSKNYRLEFKYTGEIYGTRTLSSSELEQISKSERLYGSSFIINTPNATIIRLTKECLIYGYSPTRIGSDSYAIRRLLGDDKTALLKSYVSFYIKDPVLQVFFTKLVYHDYGIGFSFPLIEI